MDDGIVTAAGRWVYPLRKDPGELDVFDIAHSLSNVCRFGGHTITHYSVAQHCVLCARWLPDRFKLWGLMHDAAEAFLGDQMRPIKERLAVRVIAAFGSRVKHVAHGGGRSVSRPAIPFKAIEDRVLKLIADRYRLGWPIPGEVKTMDDRLLVTEMRDVTIRQPWEATAKALGVSPLDTKIEAWPHDLAKREFLEAFDRLTKMGAHGS